MTHEIVPNPIKILIADDKKEICESLKESLLIELEKFNLSKDLFIINIAFTEHAYEHGCQCITSGFHPDICIFDLVFNGYTGIDLYKYITNVLSNKKINLCIYTGVEKTYEKRKEAEIMASQMQGLIKVIPKPNINEILDWFENILINNYNFEKKVEEIDPFDLL